jgi:hypothetical protein
MAGGRGWVVAIAEINNYLRKNSLFPPVNQDKLLEILEKYGICRSIHLDRGDMWNLSVYPPSLVRYADSIGIVTQLEAIFGNSL